MQRPTCFHCRLYLFNCSINSLFSWPVAIHTRRKNFSADQEAFHTLWFRVFCLSLLHLKSQFARHEGISRSGVTAPRILNFGNTRWRWAESSTLRQLYLQGNRCQYPLRRRRRLGGENTCLCQCMESGPDLLVVHPITYYNADWAIPAY